MAGLLGSFAGTFSLPLPLGEVWGGRPSGGRPTGGRPTGGRPTGEGKRQLDRSRRLLVAFCSCIAVGGRGVRPAAQSLSFAPPKEPGARKGGPTDRVPALRFGQPAVLVPEAVRQNSLLSLRSMRSNSCRKLDHEAVASCGATARPWPCAPRHGQRGGIPDSGHCFARPSNGWSFPYRGKINSRPSKGWFYMLGITS